jgi:hypothetical protein
MHEQQLIKRWWIYGIVVATAIGIVDSIFCHQNSKGGWYKKRMDEGDKGIACNGSKKVLEVRKIIQQRVDSDKDG